MEIIFYIPYNDENRKLVYGLSSLYMEIVHYFTFPTLDNRQMMKKMVTNSCTRTELNRY